MQRGVYSGATAMAAAQQMLDIVANNLANASTTGFKRDGAVFDDGMLRELAADAGKGKPLGTIGSGAVLKGHYTDQAQGAVVATGNALDLALMRPNTAFAVQTAAGIRYTRAGNFAVSPDQILVDGSGRPVLDNRQKPIELGKGEIEVSPEGQITQNGTAIAEIGVWQGSFAKQGDSLLVSSDAVLDADPAIQSRALEQSNVNVINEMVAMIRLNRAFELATRSIQSQDEQTQRLLQSVQGR